LKAADSRIYKAFRDATAILKTDRYINQIDDLLIAGRWDEAMESIEVVMARVAAANAASFIASAESEAKMLQQLGLDAASFDVTHRRAAASIDASRRSLMERLNTAQRMAIEEGGHSITRDQRKRQLRQVMGLTGRDAKAVANFRSALENGDRDALRRARRDRRFDKTVEKAISGGKPLSKEQIDRMVDRYAQRALDDRAKEVARQESLAAHHEGQNESYAQLLDTGDITADEITVEWKSVSDGKVRDSHVHLHGQKKKEGEPFEGLFSLIRYPGDPLAAGPERYGCRCFTKRKIDLSSVLGADDPEPEGEEELIAAINQIAGGTPATPPAPARGAGRAAPDPGPVTVQPASPQAGIPIPPAATPRQRTTKSAFTPAITKSYMPEFAGSEVFRRAIEGLERITIRNSQRGGNYSPERHEIMMPSDWKKSTHRKKWVGTFFHEVGHAVDFGPSGNRDYTKAKSVAMMDDLLADRADLVRPVGDPLRKKPSEAMPPEADRQLQAILKDDDGGAEFEFHEAMDAGDFEKAVAVIQGTIRKRSLNSRSPEVLETELDDIYLHQYIMGNVNDFLGAITDLERGRGHSKAYYANFQKIGDGVTVGHVAEAFANAFMGHTLEFPELLQWMMESMAPRTIAKFRQIIEEGDTAP